MIEQLPTVLSALVSDGFGLAALPAGNFAGLVLSAPITRLLGKRAETARNLLLTELSHGEKPITAPEVEEAVAVLFRYMRAAQEGAARLNLRLMAKAIAGQAHLGRLTASEFLADADVLASLKHPKILLLATMYQAWTAEPGKRDAELITWAESKLIPAVFRDIEELLATAGALTRTGLLRGEPSWDRPIFTPTSLLARLNSLASLEAAILEEDREPERPGGSPTV